MSLEFRFAILPEVFNHCCFAQSCVYCHSLFLGIGGFKMGTLERNVGLDGKLHLLIVRHQFQEQVISGKHALNLLLIVLEELSVWVLKG